MLKNKKRFSSACFSGAFLTGAILLFAFTGCFSPWKGGEGYLNINLGSGTARAGWFIQDENPNYDQEIILDGPGGRISQKIAKGVTSVSIKLLPGDWDVTVRATGVRPKTDPLAQEGIIDYESLDFPAVMLKAIGFANTTIEAGKISPVKINMVTATEVFNFKQLEFAMQNVNTNEYIMIENNITIEHTLSAVNIANLIAEKDVTLKRDTENPDNTNALFEANNGTAIFLGRKGMKAKLIIDGGNSESTRGALFNIGDESLGAGTLVMYDGVILTNNRKTYNGITGDQSGYGGAIYAINSYIEINGGEIRGNSAECGAGIYMSQSNLNMYGGSIIDNAASNSGGGVYLDNNSYLFMNNSSGISRNTASYSGGGIYGINASNLVINDSSTVSLNQATSGGGIFADSMIIQMPGGSIKNNTAKTLGGGIYLNSDCSLLLTGNAAITGNNSFQGGGLYSMGQASLEGNSVITGNTANWGGGIYIKTSIVTMNENAEISGNQLTSTDGFGGGVCMNGNDAGGAYLHISGGVIYGIKAGGQANIPTSLCVLGAEDNAEYGNIDNNEWFANGSLLDLLLNYSTNATIRVKNGELAEN